MKCIHCKKDINDNSKFCTYCGKSVTNKTSSIADKITSYLKINNLFKGKNLAIIILSFLLFISIIGQPSVTDYENNINTLNTTISKQKEIISSNQDDTIKLQNENTQLKDKIAALEKENESLKNSAQNTESKPSNTDTVPVTTTTQPKVQNNEITEMVWVGNTGTKYHIQSCGTLKGKGHQITLQQAISEGRQACKVCH